jgi:hypothetical protein
MAFGIGRRELIAGLGSAALALPHAARAQKPAMSVVGFLGVVSGPEAIPDLLAAFRRGLAEAGFVEGKNLVIEYRFANFRPEERLQGRRSVGRGGGDCSTCSRQVRVRYSHRCTGSRA